MVGVNRRVSPFTAWLRERFADCAEPVAVHCTVNAGPIPSDHWMYDPQEGGGRIVGEVCHFVDLIQSLTGSVPVRAYAQALAWKGYRPDDNVLVTLAMANGAVASITYVASGDKRHPRERIEVLGGGAVGVIENFRRATYLCRGRRQRIRHWLSVDRGYRGEFGALLGAIRSGTVPAPVQFQEYIYTTMATFAIEESLRCGVPVAIDPGALDENHTLTEGMRPENG